MNESRVLIGSSRKRSGVLWRRRLFGRATALAALVATGAMGVLSYVTNDPYPVALWLGLLLFFAHAAWLYIEEQRLKDEDDVPESADPALRMSSDVLLQAHDMYMDSAILAEAALHTKNGEFLLSLLGLPFQNVWAKCGADITAIPVQDLLQKCAKGADDANRPCIAAQDICAELFLCVDPCVNMLHEQNLSREELSSVLKIVAMRRVLRSAPKAFDPQLIGGEGSSLARSWVSGYTDDLDTITTEISSVRPSYGEQTVSVHADAVAKIIETLGKTRGRNALIIGKPGVGKRSAVRNASRALRALEQSKNLSYTRMVELHTEQLLAAVNNRERYLHQALSRAQNAGAFVLVVRELGLLLHAADPVLTSVLLKCLDAPNLSIIGIMDEREYHALVKTQPSMDVMFEKIHMDDCTDEETIHVLVAHALCTRSRARVTYKALQTIVELSRRFLAVRQGMPGCALDVLDEARAVAERNGQAFVTEDHVRSVITERSHVDVRQVGDAEKQALMHLEEILEQQVIGQAPAVHAVAAALKRARLDLQDRKRPIGTFLFLGPTGVGKTQTAKTLAQQYFGSADAMIRLDMNEFSHQDSVLKLTGGNADDESYLTRMVQDKPFSLILLDEIEKAHPTVLNLFLQILDEGIMTDAQGARVDFTNSIIIATSNAGAEFIRTTVQNQPTMPPEDFRKCVIENILQQKLFSPEFVNRFDEVVVFQPLNKESAMKVANLMTDEIVAEVEQRKGIHVQLGADVLAALVEKGYSLEFGARELRRTVTKILEDFLADYLLAHKVERGTNLPITREDLHL